MRVLMVAAENGGLPGGKVGGMGDVIRDVPLALADSGIQVDVLTPGYQHFSKLPGATKTAEFKVPFAGRQESVALYRITEKKEGKVVYWALEHPSFAPQGDGKIYCDDLPGRPFATDATKFALFCAAVCQGLIVAALELPDVIHIHDWHAALVAVLATSDPACKALADIHRVYTIHNLSLQGVRPFQGDESSLQAWFPNLHFDVSSIKDPRYPDCFNPMRAAINHCDRVHAVSPNYATEIILPSAPEQGFIGGEGLEKDLQMAHNQKRLVGILNGCEYPAPVKEGALKEFMPLAATQVRHWIGATRTVNSAHFLAAQFLEQWSEENSTELVLTSVGRLTDQKARLFIEQLPDGRHGLEAILKLLGERGLFILLGSGDPVYEHFFTQMTARHDNFLFLQGYAEELSDVIYAMGDLFLMPSSFEPCGISQMLAMRVGQPCLVHGVGGLADTVKDATNGFVFSGDSAKNQAQAMANRFAEVVDVFYKNPEQWKKIRRQAAKARFTWAEVAKQYQNQLYSIPDKPVPVTVPV